MNPRDKIKDSIIQKLLLRGTEKTICPSEVARTLFPRDWRDHMNEVRAVAFELVEEGVINVTQKGSVVDLETVKGPIRLKLRN